MSFVKYRIKGLTIEDKIYLDKLEQENLSKIIGTGKPISTIKSCYYFAGKGEKVTTR